MIFFFVWELTRGLDTSIFSSVDPDRAEEIEVKSEITLSSEPLLNSSRNASAYGCAIFTLLELIFDLLIEKCSNLQV